MGPLIEARPKNFRDLLLKLLSLTRSTNFCRRRVQSMQPMYIPDFGKIEQKTSELMTESTQTWFRFVFDYPRLDVRKWHAMIAEFEEAKRGKMDLLEYCAECCDEIWNEREHMIHAELPEVQRLIRAQILCANEIILFGLPDIKQEGAFEALAPSKIPEHLFVACQQKRQTLMANGSNNVDDHQEMCAYIAKTVGAIPAYAALLHPGVLWIFRDRTMNSLLLTCQIAMVAGIEFDDRQVTLIDVGRNNLCKFQIERGANKWEKNLRKFCEDGRESEAPSVLSML